MRCLVLALLAASPTAAAMEGHWRPEQVPALAPELAELGLALAPESLSDPAGAPLGAIVDLDYCSGAFVSPDGLIATAYHCVTDGLQFASRPGEDLFEQGFHAETRAQERWAGPAQTVRLTLASQDVTEDALAGTARLVGLERLERVERNIRGLVRRCEGGGDVHCEVAVYGDGVRYELITQRELRDVRLVYAPPRAVGYFGGDADNWRWPRHSGDFAFLRAYGTKDGRPAGHHPANVPWRPKTHLPVAARGPAPGEFVMVAGYPNVSYRWRSAAELDFAQEEAYPLRIEVRAALVRMLEEHAARHPEIAPRIGPRRLELANDLAYLRGTHAQLERFGITRDRWALERDLATWIEADPARYDRFGTMLDRIHRLQAEEAATWRRDHLVGQMVAQVDLLHAARRIHKLALEADEPDRDREAGYQNRDRPAIVAELDERDARWDFRVDRAILAHLLAEVMRLPEGLHVAELDRWLDRDEATPLEEAIATRLEALYADVDLADADKRRDLMGTSARYLEQASGNPWFRLAAALHPFLERQRHERRVRQAEWREVAPLYAEALRQFIPETRPRYLAGASQLVPGQFYPDANGTLRLTFGKVDGYFPRDGLIAAPHTTARGLALKAGSRPYDAPPVLLEAIAAGSYGPYVDPRTRSVPVDFLSTLDTARGSSGSATLNADGELVGIIFDGNHEAIASDWIFDEATTRSIHTDVTFVLWYLDRIAGAAALIEELGHPPAFAGPELGAAD